MSKYTLHRVNKISEGPIEKRMASSSGRVFSSASLLPLYFSQTTRALACLCSLSARGRSALTPIAIENQCLNAPKRRRGRCASQLPATSHCSDSEHKASVKRLRVRSEREFAYRGHPSPESDYSFRKERAIGLPLMLRSVGVGKDCEQKPQGGGGGSFPLLPCLFCLQMDGKGGGREGGEGGLIIISCIR